jgi:hypothetical protein
VDEHHDRPFLRRALRMLLQNDPFAQEIGRNVGRELLRFSRQVPSGDAQGDPLDHRREATLRASCYVSLGLEMLSHGDIELAAALLKGGRLRRFFRCGRRVSDALHGEAALLLADPQVRPGPGPGSVLDPQDAQLLEIAADDPPRRELADGTTRQVQTLSDVDAVERTLARVAFQVRLSFEMLPLTVEAALQAVSAPPAPSSMQPVTLNRVLVANFENVLAGHPADGFELLPMEERCRLAASCCDGSGLSQRARHTVSSWFDGLLESKGCSGEEQAMGHRLPEACYDTWSRDLIYLRKCQRRGVAPERGQMWILANGTGGHGGASDA